MWLLFGLELEISLPILVKWLVTSRIYWFPLGVSGRGPRMSVANLSKDAPTGIVPSGVWGFWGHFLTETHASHFSNYKCESSLTLNHWTNSSQVFHFPRCPLRDSCIWYIILSVKFLGTINCRWSSDPSTSVEFLEQYPPQSAVVNPSTASSVVWPGWLLPLKVQKVC